MAKREAIPVEINKQSEFLGKNVGPLGLVNQILEQMDIRKIVEHYCEPDSRREIPVGEVIHALVANRLCAPDPLLHVAEWAEHSGAEFLLGVPTVLPRGMLLPEFIFPHILRLCAPAVKGWKQE